ncbi:peptide-methionine (S)-S-oxide reductase [Christiangramia aquimixticola]|uniref:peptide-methionine (S)-S-oxide reductase n=1 Tax=Christiangramia aquimixticola TaxID=1697558 RepID=UPI003AA92F3A
MPEIIRIGFGGGCHWCTEAVFQRLKGVEDVTQGYLNTTTDDLYSEGILLKFDPEIIPVKVLIEIHIRTHQSFHNHSMRDKYKSGIYVFNKNQKTEVVRNLHQLQEKFSEKIITEVYTIKVFKESREEIKNYYNKDPHRPFCIKYIEPKLDILRMEFKKYLK